MSYVIKNKNVKVYSAHTVTDIARYFKNNHPKQKGFSKRTLSNNEIQTLNNTYSKDNFEVTKTSNDKRIKQMPSLGPRNSIVSAFRKRNKTKFNNNIILNLKNLPHVMNKLREDIIGIKKLRKLTWSKTNFKIVIQTVDSDDGFNVDGKNIGSKFLSFNLVIDDIERKLIKYLTEYDGGNMLVSDIVIEYLVTGNKLGRQIIYGQKDDTDIIDVFNTCEIIGEMVINTKSNKKLIKLLKENKVYSPSTNKNCFLKACYASKFKKKDIKDKVDYFVEKNTIEEYSTDYLGPLISETLRCKINVHFIENEIETITYGKYKEEINVMIHNSHAISLIKRDGERPDKPEDVQELIVTPKYKDKSDDYIIATFDFETCNLEEDKLKKNNTEVYAIGFYDGKNYKEFYKKTKDDNILKKFIKYLFDDYEETKIIMYAHNGGKFDIYLLLETLLKDSGACMTSYLEQTGRIINIQMNSKTKTIILRDSLNLIASSLDSACKSFKPKTVKLEGDVEHDKININNCYTKKIYKYTSGYLKNDCLSLYEILEKFDNIIDKAYGFSVKDVMTNASIARRVYLDKYYDEDVTPLYKLTKEVDKELRKYYYGGRNEVMTKLGYTKGKLYYVDFTSLYPYIMSKYKIQYGKMNIINVEDKDKKVFNKKWFGFIKCRFRNKHKKEIPLHAIIKDNKLVFPHVDNWEESVISSEEIRYAIDNKIGYEYEFIKVYNYKKKSVHFKKIVNDLYKMKIDAQKDGNKALRSIAKIIINSLYGFFGINYLNRDQKVITLEKDSQLKKKGVKVGITKATHKTEAKLYGYLSSQQLKDYNRVDGYDVYSIEGEIKSGCANVGIASMITSYARLELYKLMRDLKKKGGKIYYMDTDSVVTDYDIFNDKVLNKKWVGSGGDELGELTNETDQKGGYYTELVTLGNKMYALKNDDLEKEGMRRVIKLKGINSKMKFDKKVIDDDKKTITFTGMNKFTGKHMLCFDDYKLISEGYILEVDNMNFLAGINEMMVKKKGLIKINNTKKIRKLYDKAIVNEDGSITPHKI